MAPAAVAPTVLLVAPHDSYRLGAYRRACEAIGAAVVVATDRGSPLGTATVVVDVGDPAAVERLVDLGAHAVIGTDSETLELASLVARRLGATGGNDPEAAGAATDKAAQRLAAARAGVAQPGFAVVTPDGDPVAAALDLGFPVVVKPVSLTASRGVQRAEDPLDVAAAAAFARGLTPGRPILVERFVPGGELALDGLLHDGALHPLAVFDKPDAPQGPTFPETLLVAPARVPAAVTAAVVDATTAVCRALGLRQGPVHAEFRLPPEGPPQFLELAARTIGGRCAQLLRTADGRPVEEAHLRLALGLPVELAPATGAFGVAMLAVPRSGTVRAVGDHAAALAVEGVDDVWIDVAPGQRVVALPEAGDYAGFVFAHGADADAVEHTLRAAVALLPLSVDG